MLGKMLGPLGVGEGNGSTMLSSFGWAILSAESFYLLRSLGKAADDLAGVLAAV
jgi:hypothetical protein